MTVGTLEELSQEAGIPKEKIHQLRDNYVSKLMRRGLIVALHIGYYRFKASLTDSDLGIKLTDKEKQYITLGCQRVFPPTIVKKLELLESRGRNNLLKNSLQILFGYFVPATALKEFREENDAIRSEFMEVRDAIRDRYDDLRMEAQEDLVHQGEQVYDRLEKKPEGTSRQKWVKEFAATLVSRVPDKESIFESFSWKLDFSYVPLTSDLQEEALRQEKLNKDQQLLHYETQDRMDQIREMNRLVAEQMKAQKEQTAKDMNKFLDQTVFKVRDMVGEVCQQVLHTMKRNDGALMGSSVKSLRGVIDRARALNFYNDEELTDSLKEMEKAIGTSPKRRNNRKVQNVLTSIGQAMKKSARAVESVLEKEEELARIIGKDMVKAARKVE